MSRDGGHPAKSILTSPVFILISVISLLTIGAIFWYAESAGISNPYIDRIYTVGVGVIILLFTVITVAWTAILVIGGSERRMRR